MSKRAYKALRKAVESVVVGMQPSVLRGPDRSKQQDAMRGGINLELLETRQMLSQVSGAYLFYNNSTFDGDNPAINVADDAAIAPDKRPLRELQTATFANYSSYLRGINGLMPE